MSAESACCVQQGKNLLHSEGRKLERAIRRRKNCAERRMVCKLDSAMLGVDGAGLMVHASTIQPCAGWMVRGGWCVQARFSDARGGWCARTNSAMRGADIAQAGLGDARVGRCASTMRGADGACKHVLARFGDAPFGWCASTIQRCAGRMVHASTSRRCARMVHKHDSAMCGVDEAGFMVHASTIRLCAGWMVRGGWCASTIQRCAG